MLVDWLPWSHTFGGNHNFNMALFNGGTLYIDDGSVRPAALSTQTLAQPPRRPAHAVLQRARGFAAGRRRSRTTPRSRSASSSP